MAEKRMGRPRKAPEKGPRQNYTFRMHDQTRELVYAAAEANGRSLSEEIEARIEASFAEDRMRAIAREEMDRREAERAAGLLQMLRSRLDRDLSMLEKMTPNDQFRERAAQLADEAPARTEGYLRKALEDPAVKAAVHQRYELGTSDVCDCGACSINAFHASDCAVHREPAYPNGPCDCGVGQ